MCEVPATYRKAIVCPVCLTNELLADAPDCLHNELS